MALAEKWLIYHPERGHWVAPNKGMTPFKEEAAVYSRMAAVEITKGSVLRMVPADARAMTPEEYQANVFLLTGQFVGVMMRAERGTWIPDDIAEELWTICDKMRDLYARSKDAGL